MRTEELIVALAADASPVRVIEPARVRLLAWAAAASVGTAAAAGVFGIRSDLATVGGDPRWLVELAVIAVAMTLAAVALQWSAVPGMPGTRTMRALALGVSGLWVAFVIGRLSLEGAPLQVLASEPVHVACGLRMALIALVPGGLAARQLRRAAPLEPVWSTGLAALSAVAAGLVATVLACPLDRPAHDLLWHAAPATALVGAAVLAAAVVRHSRRGAPPPR